MRRCAHADQLHPVGQPRGFVHPCQPFGVSEQHLGDGVLHGEGHFLAIPPRVHAHRGDADRDAGPVEQHPFGVIAHRDPHAVAGLDPLREQPGGDRIDHLMRLGVGHHLILVDQVGALGEHRARQPDFTHRGRGVLEHLERVAQHLGFNDFELSARPGQFLAHLAQLGIMHRSSRVCGFNCLIKCRSRTRAARDSIFLVHAEGAEKQRGRRGVAPTRVAEPHSRSHGNRDQGIEGGSAASTTSLRLPLLLCALCVNHSAPALGARVALA